MLTLLFFGVLTDVVGETEHRIQKNFADVNALNTYLISQYPELKKHHYTIAVNGEIINGNKNLENGDEVSFLPPFAGG